MYTCNPVVSFQSWSTMELTEVVDIAYNYVTSLYYTPPHVWNSHVCHACTAEGKDGKTLYYGLHDFRTSTIYFVSKANNLKGMRCWVQNVASSVLRSRTVVLFERYSCLTRSLTSFITPSQFSSGSNVLLYDTHFEMSCTQSATCGSDSLFADQCAS
jgi:hypothetical protein